MFKNKIVGFAWQHLLLFFAAIIGVMHILPESAFKTQCYEWGNQEITVRICGARECIGGNMVRFDVSMMRVGKSLIRVIRVS